MGRIDWFAWHEEYDEPGSRLAYRLPIVQARIRAALDDAPAGPLTLLSLCAGQGRDVIPVLAEHPRGADVRARLVELDPRNAAVAREAAAGLPRVEVVAGDAARLGAYAGLAPADVVLACGVFGHIPAADVQRTIACLPQLCRRGAPLIWTRYRRPPDLVPAVLEWLERAGFTLIDVMGPQERVCVGVHRLDRDPDPLEPDVSMFASER